MVIVENNCVGCEHCIHCGRDEQLALACDVCEQPVDEDDLYEDEDGGVICKYCIIERYTPITSKHINRMFNDYLRGKYEK